MNSDTNVASSFVFELPALLCTAMHVMGRRLDLLLKDDSQSDDEQADQASAFLSEAKFTAKPIFDWAFIGRECWRFDCV